MTDRIAPEGFTLEHSPPRGEVEPGGITGDPWPCIAYDCRLLWQGREVWSGVYRLGVGHVDPHKVPGNVPWLSEDELSLLYAWQRKPAANFKDTGLWATVAVKLAKAQKVAPKVDGVLHSILLDGSAFFDAQSFKEWAADFGHSSDSIKATYDQCVETGRRLTAELGAEKVAELRELYQDY